LHELFEISFAKPRRDSLTAPARSFQYRGSLAEKTLPEILYAIDRFQVPGVIEASREGVVKKVFIKEGNVLHASSTDRDDSLGSYLLRTGEISPEAYSTTMRARRNSTQRYGVLLIEQGLLSPARVYEAILQQTEEIVWSLFSWHEGEVSFRIGDFKDSAPVRLQLPMRQVILQGIKRAQDAKALVSRLGSKETRFEAEFHTESLIEIALNEEDYRLLQMVDGRRTLVELCREGPYGVPDNAKLLYAFRVLQLIRKVEPEQSPGSLDLDAPAKEESGAIKIRLKTSGGNFGD
jgi:hypothetical protein